MAGLPLEEGEKMAPRHFDMSVLANRPVQVPYYIGAQIFGAFVAGLILVGQ